MISFPRFLLILLLAVFLILGAYFLIYKNNSKNQQSPSKLVQPKVINSLKKEKVKYPEDYTIVMVGDSMTETLGNSDEIKKFLSEKYPGKTFEVLNYGFGSTNILSVVDRITKETEHGRKFRPIEDIEYDLILLESFGENPLSELGLENGLKRQRQELDKIVKILKETNPEGKIVFVASISPNKEIFAKNSVDLSAEKRAEWVNERIAYIKNHISYASKNNIPIINIFQKSLLENGDGNSDYISTDDYIHPSPAGIVFISREIADFIFNNNIFPH